MSQEIDGDQDRGRSVDEVKLIFDYLKHISTLSTGSVLLLVAFLDKLFPSPEWKALIAVSLAGFSLTLLLTLILQYMLVHTLDPETEAFGHWGAFMFVCMATSFMIGILGLVLFGLKNFY